MTKRSYVTTRFAVLVLVVGMACTSEPEPADSTPQAQVAQTSSLDGLPSTVRAMLAFQDEMRRLWEDHIVWTRGFIISTAHSLPDAGPTTQRLLRNQVDIGNAFRRFYGDRVADQTTQLLTDHILIAAQLVTAAKAGDSAAVAAASAKWTANADDIARLWSQINPRFFPFPAMQEHMHHHLMLTLDEATLRLQGDFAGDIAKYDEVQTAILEMADMLSTGIIRQFPGKFH
jgi:hypothetical protein